jgi:hypothetical protein
MANWWDDEPEVAPKKAPPVRSPWQRFKDEVFDSASHNWIGVRGLRTAVDAVRGEDTSKTHARAKQYKKRAAEGRERDAIAFEEVDTLSPANIGKHAVDLVGNIVGGVDPTYPISFGKNVVTRILSQAGINAGVDAANQGVDIARGDQKKFDKRRVLINAGAGAVVQGGFEVGRAVSRGGPLDLDTAVGIGNKFGRVTSTVRSPERNKKVGGVKNSHHLSGRAIDIARGKGVTHKQLERAYRRAGFDIIESLDEGDHSHFAFRFSKSKPKVETDASPVDLSFKDITPEQIDAIATRFDNLPPRKIEEEPLAEDIIRQADDSDEIDKLLDPSTLTKGDWERDAFETDFLNSEGHLHMGDEDFMGVMDEKFALERNYQPTAAESARMQDINHRDSGVASRDDLTGLGNVTQFPIIPRVEAIRQDGGSPEARQAAFDAEKTGKVSNLNQVKNQKALDSFVEGDEVAKARQRTQLVDLHNRLNDIREDIRKGEFHLTLDEIRQMRQESNIDSMFRLVRSKSALTPANADEIRDVHAAFDELENTFTAIRSGEMPVVKKPELKVLKGTDPKEPSNDRRRTITKLLKDLLDDESGELRVDDPEEPDVGRQWEGLTPEEKFVKAAKRAKPISSSQRRLYHEERTRRSEALRRIQQEGGGRDAYYKQLGALKGELPSADYESIARHFTEDDIRHLFDKVNFSPSLLEYEKVNAQTALTKLLGGDGLRVPTASELRLLSEVFEPDFIEALLKNRPFMEKFWKGAVSSMNIPRALMASADISAPFRQGIFLIGRKEFWKNLGPMFKVLFSEANSKALLSEIKSRDSYKLMREGGLAIVDPHKHFLLDREEDFMTDLAEKIPVWGQVVKASNRAYSGFLNRLRADYFDHLLTKYEDAGINLRNDSVKLKGLTKFINSATGRGDLTLFGKNYNNVAPVLNAAFFSPRLIKARIDMLNPATYLRQDKIVRVEAWKNMLSLGSVAVGVASLASLGGMDVETDPRSADFMKPTGPSKKGSEGALEALPSLVGIGVQTYDGKTRYDTLGGFQQFIRLAAQLVTNQKVNGKGELTDIFGGRRGVEGKGPYDDTLAGIIGKFFRSKENPVVSTAHNYLEGENVVGEPFNRTKEIFGVDVPEELLERFISMSSNDIIDAYVGAASREKKEPKPKKSKKSSDDNWWEEKASTKQWWED